MEQQLDTTSVTSVSPFMGNKINYGRKRIILNYDKVTPENVMEVLQKAQNIFASNRKDCEYLIKYFLGEQDILSRSYSPTSNINNRTVINYAYPITREIVGYTFGNKIELVQKNLNKVEEITKVADIYDYENAYYVDICTAIYASICGIGYQITLPSVDINKDSTPEIPITYNALDPRTTFVVQSSQIGNPQIMSCAISTNNENKKVYTCYTNEYKITITNMDANTMKIEKNLIGLDPITMVENSLFLTGDWEQAISVLNAINQVGSDALNDIEGTIRSLLVILGAEFGDDDDSDINKIKTQRILTLINKTGGNVDAKFIAPHLDSVSVENLREYLDEARNVITGIPDRSANSSGGDTGQAVLNRDGWTDMEIVARLKELFFKKAKKRQLAIGIKILQMLDFISKDLSILDIEPVIGRHTTDNLQTKTQAFSTLVATGELATIDCLELSNLTNRSREMVERGKQAKEEKMKEQEKLNPPNQDNQDNEQKNDNGNNEA